MSANLFRIRTSVQAPSLLTLSLHLCYRKPRRTKRGSTHGQQVSPTWFQISFSSPPLIPSPSLTSHFRRPLPRVTELRTHVSRDLSQPVMVWPPLTRPPWGPWCSEETGYSLCLLFPRASLLCAFSKFRKQSTAQGDGERLGPPTWC